MQEDLRTYDDERSEDLWSVSSTQAQSFSESIEAFIRVRLQLKLEKVKQDEQSLRQALIEQYRKDTWLESAAKRASQIQAVTHSLKALHPSARGTNLLATPSLLPSLRELGTHALSRELVIDVVGSASALDVYKFLRLEVNGCTLLSALLDRNPEAMAALHSDKARSLSLRNALVSPFLPRQDSPSSHALAKQLYWLTGTDACRDDHFTLVAPLFATSLTHAVHVRVEQARYGQANKMARNAKQESSWYEGTYQVYPSLASRNIGGTQPQNISQLNSERKGLSYLLSSQPPASASRLPRLPANTRSVFEEVFPYRPKVQHAIEQMRRYPPGASEHLETLLDELVLMSTGLQRHKRGWTLQEQVLETLDLSEQLWLDPRRAELPGQEHFADQWLQLQWPAQVGHRFEACLDELAGRKLDWGTAQLDWKELLTQDGAYALYLRDLRARKKSLTEAQS